MSSYFARGKKRKIVLSLGIAAFCLGVVITRVFWDGRAALRDGDAALARALPEEAIVAWRRAARWYAPGAPHVHAAYARLEELARVAESQGDRLVALEAWRAVRSSCLSTRSFYTPFSEKLPIANEKIAELMALVEGGDDQAQKKAWHLEKLARIEAPSVAWSAVALLGLAAWIGGGFLFAWKGLTEKDKLNVRAAAQSGLLVAAGLIVWMLGLYRA